jgi:uncharacterized protein (TIGR02145 family)
MKLKAFFEIKSLLYFVLALSVASFADAECERIYHKFIKTLSKQKTKTCRVSGVDDDRTDIMGFFFHFGLQGTEYPAVLIYGSDYDPMLYSGDDYYVKHAKCIKNDRYRILYTVMTPEQIAAKLLSFKKCGDDFNHPANEGPHTTSSEDEKKNVGDGLAGLLSGNANGNEQKKSDDFDEGRCSNSNVLDLTVLLKDDYVAIGARGGFQHIYFNEMWTFRCKANGQRVTYTAKDVQENLGRGYGPKCPNGKEISPDKYINELEKIELWTIENESVDVLVEDVVMKNLLQIYNQFKNLEDASKISIFIDDERNHDMKWIKKKYGPILNKIQKLGFKEIYFPSDVESSMRSETENAIYYDTRFVIKYDDAHANKLYKTFGVRKPSKANFAKENKRCHNSFVTIEMKNEQAFKEKMDNAFKDSARVSKILKDIAGLQTTGKTSDRRSKADGGSNDGGRGVGDGLAGLLGGGIAASQKGTMKDTEIMKDSRDGQTYKTVKIGKQVWMAENLNYETENSYCYDNDLANCQKYGRLYTWEAALNACPEGWRLPTNADFETLFANVRGIETAGKMLKSRTGWADYEGKSGNGIDKYGFNVLPAGIRNNDGSFNYAGRSANFWSATEYKMYGAAYLLDLSYPYEDAPLLSNFKDRALSVRCLKD